MLYRYIDYHNNTIEVYHTKAWYHQIMDSDSDSSHSIPLNQQNDNYYQQNSHDVVLTTESSYSTEATPIITYPLWDSENETRIDYQKRLINAVNNKEINNIKELQIHGSIKVLITSSNNNIKNKTLLNNLWGLLCFLANNEVVSGETTNKFDYFTNISNKFNELLKNITTNSFLLDNLFINLPNG